MVTRSIVVLCVACCLCRVSAQEDQGVPADLQFEHAFSILEKADELRDKGRLEAAIGMYRQAHKSYASLSEKYPMWQSGMVGFRMAYCNDQLKALTRRLRKERARQGAPGAPGVEGTQPWGRQDGGPDVLPPSGQGSVGSLATLIEIGKYLLRNRQPEKARTLLLQGLRIDPDDPTTRLLIGMAQCMAGKYADAVFLLQQLTDEQPHNVHARLTLASAYLGLGRAAEAEAETVKVLDLKPDMKEAHYNMVQLLLAREDSDTAAAREHYERYLELGGEADAQVEQAWK